jgi:DNA-binding HxlR family transcriptional regulator
MTEPDISKESTKKWHWYPLETTDDLLRWDVLSQTCRTRPVLSRIGEKWTMLVVALTDTPGASH